MHTHKYTHTNTRIQKYIGLFEDERDAAAAVTKAVACDVGSEIKAPSAAPAPVAVSGPYTVGSNSYQSEEGTGLLLSKKKGKTSKYHGVTWNNRNQKWQGRYCKVRVDHAS